MKPLFDALLNFFFPPFCHVCRTFIPEAGMLHICPACYEHIYPVSHPLCSLCGMPFSGAGGDHLCGSCQTSKPSFDAARAALIYEGHCRELIHAYKYRYKTHLSRPLALLIIDHLAEFVASRAPDIIVPVPLHVRRLRNRGFNQAVLLGEMLAQEWRLPFYRQAMCRTRWTEPQISLTAAERRTNVRGAFEVSKTAIVNDRCVLLVDDVYTTGCTVEECSKVLKSAGASEVVVVTVARAMHV